tara:strand:+ start:272 stop:946 length:675 start_codon:yes stop_codon:yes gene_type:complete
MPLQINKKIFFYIFLFIFLGTLNNKDLNKIELFNLEDIKVIGLKNDENHKLINQLEFFRFENLYFLDQFEIESILNSNNLIKDYSIFKRYPSTIEINVNRTSFLAKVKKNGKNFYLGSNGKLIENQKNREELPFIFGEFNNKDFFNLVGVINNTKFDYKEIKNLFFFSSGRWDIETHSGVIIKLPRDKLEESFDLTLRILNQNNFNQIEIIDVRQKNQVILNEQ